MASPFNVPDEFVQGFFKSGQRLVQSFAGTSAGGLAPASRLATAQAHYWQQQMALWMGMMTSVGGQRAEPVVTPERGDRRFSADAWRDSPWYSLLEETYLLNSRLLEDMVDTASLGEKEKHKLRFFARAGSNLRCNTSSPNEVLAWKSKGSTNSSSPSTGW